MRNLGSLAVGLACLALGCGGKSASPDGGTGGTGGAGGKPGCPSVDGAATVAITHPNPLISLGATAYGSPSAGVGSVTNGIYHNGGWNAGNPTPSAPAWVAIKLGPWSTGAGPTRVLLEWDDGGTYDYDYYTKFTPPPQTVYGLPTEYHIDVSADSTNGSDGTWTTAVPTVENEVRTRAHSFDFTGMSWVKMVITNSPTNMPDAGVSEPGGVVIGQIDVHDLSAAGSCLPDDTWFFMGDSITAFAYDRAPAHQPSFAANINGAVPQYFPAMINGGIGSEKAGDGVVRLTPDFLATVIPDSRFIVLGYGTNDAANGQIPVYTFQSNMQTMIDTVLAAGRIPILPHIPASPAGPYADVPTYNAAIDQLTASNNLITGADLYGYFIQHQDEFMSDGIHPNNAGFVAMNALWATAMQPLYR
jgi:lysophospholipase L1-like esterase